MITIDTKGAEYASQVPELQILPVGYIDKQVCGCGLTTVALTNSVPTIVAVPNISLVYNKVQQLDTLLGVTGSTTKKDINIYMHEAAENGTVPKIIVTYDSLSKVSDLLGDGWSLVIDESDSILKSNALKLFSKTSASSVDVISKLLSICEKNKDKVSFISATPTPAYLLGEWVADLPQIVITWSNVVLSWGMTMKRPQPFDALKKEIILPMLSDGYVDVKGSIIKKAVIFINSVTAIMNVIKENKLKPADVAIMCGDSLSNSETTAGYPRLKDPTNLPKFTFITSTGFQGIDLYDEEAMPIVVSSASRNYTMIDLTSDLKQATSRIRNKNNAHVGKYVFIYNKCAFDQTEEELLAHLKSFRNGLGGYINNYNAAEGDTALAYREVSEDSKKFLKYTKLSADGKGLQVNDLSFNADQHFIISTRRAYDEGYKTSINLGGVEVSKAIKIAISKSVTTYEDVARAFKDSLKNGGGLKDQEPKILSKTLCSWGEFTSIRTEWYDLIVGLYQKTGSVIINITRAEDKLASITPKSVGERFKSVFKVGGRYSTDKAKSLISDIYNKNNISRVPRTRDLLDFFVIEEGRNRDSRFIKIISHVSK